MHYSGITFRPPIEANSLVLQVTTGCSHNKCSFCAMYRDTPFSVSPVEEIEADLQEAAVSRPRVKRVFLLNGDAFCLPYDHLARIAELIHQYLPNVETIGAYASVYNVLTKTDTQLADLAELGYANINLGIESGLEDVLATMNKGTTVLDARMQMERLHRAGLPFTVNIIIAAAGPDRLVEHAAANAALVNEASPTIVFASPLHIDPRTPLYEDWAAGLVPASTIRQYLMEEYEFVSRLNLYDCMYYGLHIATPEPVSGWLPRDKEKILAEIDARASRLPRVFLDTKPVGELTNLLFS